VIIDRFTVSPEPAVSFGPFRLLLKQRLLLQGEQPLRLGSRALDLLIALVERAGELVSKKELMARVWPDTVVEECNIKVHIASLRRALADGQSGHRYLATVPGRGYRFVAPVVFTDEPVALPRRRHNLPARLSRLIGRADAVSKLAGLLPRQRFVTIVGTGGIGKTSVALAVAEKLMANYEHGGWLIELGHLADPALVPVALASALGMEPKTPLPELIASISEKQILLVLDNCEHVIEAAAALAVSVLKAAPGAQVLATSREPLGAEGERVQRLAPLASPPPWQRMSPAEVLRFPAVRLFVERATSTGEIALSDGEAPLVAEICRKLDGLPLAIELAAARVSALGIRGLTSHLDNRSWLRTSGHRAGPARHQSMSAALDWSYGLLTTGEQTFLRRLAIFPGAFTFRAAAAVAADIDNSEFDVVDRVTKLVAKSLITAEGGGPEPRFRLFETTRAYVLKKLAESGEGATIWQRSTAYRRSAAYHRDVLEAAALLEAAA